MLSTHQHTGPATPLPIVLVRVLVTIQLVAGFAATVLLGMLGVLAVAFVDSGGGSALGVATLFVGLVAVCLFLLISLGRSLAGLQRGNHREHSVLVTIEGILVTTLLLMLAMTNSFGTGSLGDLASVPAVVIATGAAVLALLATPTARAWTSGR